MTSLKDNSDMELLEKLQELESDPAVKELEDGLKKFNYFTASGMHTQEIKHSKTLSFLLDPNESHRQEALFLKSFLKYFLDAKEMPGDLLGVRCETEVFTNDGRRMDIVIHDNNNRFCICIENKIAASESENQLKDYQSYINVAYKNVPERSRILVFLTPQGDPPTDEKDQKYWREFSYNNILDILSECKPEINNRCNDDFKTFLLHYEELIKDHVVKRSAESAKALEIYKNHKAALDYIIENIPSEHIAVYAEIKNAFDRPGKSTPNCFTYISEQAKIFRFRPSNWNFSEETTPNKGVWKGEAVLFEVCINKPKNQSKLKLELVFAHASRDSRIKNSGETLAKDLNIEVKRDWPRIATCKNQIDMPDLDIEDDGQRKKVIKGFRHDIEKYWMKWIKDKSEKVSEILDKRNTNKKTP